MADITLVIKIPEEIYEEALKSGYSHLYDECVADAVAHGVPVDVQTLYDAPRNTIRYWYKEYKIGAPSKFVQAMSGLTHQTKEVKGEEMKTVEPNESAFASTEMPEDIIKITRWGNRYFLEDCIKGITIRLDSELFWKTLDKVEMLTKTVGLNK